MTMKTAAKALFALTLAGMAAGALSPQAHAQSRSLNPLEQRQSAAQTAFLRRQEAAARKKGHYNDAYWASKERKNYDYWNGKVHPRPAQHPTPGHPAGPGETSLQREVRQDDGQEALLQRQEAAARKKGHYNAAYWASKERAQAAYWSKKGVH